MMMTESDQGKCRSAANIRNVAVAAQGNKDELRHIIMG
jgi:hypothetical protein